MRNYAAEGREGADSYQFVQQHVPLCDRAPLCTVAERVRDADWETGGPPERRGGGEEGEGEATVAADRDLIGGFREEFSVPIEVTQTLLDG